MGNSVTTLKAKDIRNTGTENLFGALQGKIAGAQITQTSGDPSGSFSIRLRGTKSLRGNSDPLYVIDGVVASNAAVNVSQLATSGQAGEASLGQNRLADLNPNDIESLSVLNGAAAAAVYGSRASNGVVLITTKRGKSGDPKFTFSSSISMGELRKRVFISTYGKQFGDAAIINHTITSISAAQQVAFPNITTSPYIRDGATFNLATNQVDVTRYDYQDNIFRTAVSKDNYFSVAAGNDKSQYYASISYSDTEGIVKGTNFQRIGVRMRLNQQLAKWLKATVGINYNNSFSNEKASGNVFYSPINSVNITNNIYDITRRDALGNLLAVQPARVNPLSTLEDMEFTQSTNRVISDLQLNATPFKNFGIDFNMGVDNISQVGKNYIRPYPYQAVANLPLERYPFGYAANANNSTIQLNTDLILKYKIDFSDKLNLNLITGVNNQYQKSEFLTTQGTNLAPNVTTVNGASSATVTSGYGLDQFRVYGQFVQGTLGYVNRFFVTGAVRRDGASVFSPDNNNQIYPKVSTSLVVLENQKSFLSEAKLRGSYGKSGGLTALGTYDRFYQFSTPAFLGLNTIVPGTRLANPNVVPEVTTEFEVGTDLTFIKNFATLSVSYYEQKIKDLIVNRTIASTSGGSSIVNNFGGMSNKGYEATLGLNVIDKKDMSLTFDFVYSKNVNLITDLPGGTTSGIANSAVAPIAIIEGQPASIFFGTAYARNPDGSLLLNAQGFVQQERVGRDAAGQPTGTVLLKVIGDPNPDWTGSFRTNFRYKKFGFRASVDAVQGFDVFNADKRTRNNIGIGDIAEQELKGQAPRGTVLSLVPIEEYRVEDGSFVKVREIGVSYRFTNIGFKNNDLTFEIAGRNLFVFTKYSGYDPETNAGGGANLLRGLDFGNVPIPRSIQFSATFNF